MNEKEERWTQFAASALAGVAGRGLAAGGDQARSAALIADAMESEYHRRYPSEGCACPECLPAALERLADSLDWHPVTEEQRSAPATEQASPTLALKVDLMQPFCIPPEHQSAVMGFDSVKCEGSDYTVYGRIEKRGEAYWVVPTTVEQRTPVARRSNPAEPYGKTEAKVALTSEELLRLADDPEVKNAVGPPTRFA